MSSPATGTLPIKTPSVVVEYRHDGSILMAQTYPTAPPARSIPHRFIQQAEAHPHRVFVAKRAALKDGAWGDWIKLSYGQALREAQGVAQWMLDRGIGPDRSVLVLSGPSPEHAVMALAGMFARAPVTAVATAYSLVAQDFEKLHHVVRMVKPALIFVEGPEYRRALDALDLSGIEVVTLVPIPGIEAHLYADVAGTAPASDVERSVDMISPDTTARFVFTSGSTGAPKAVVHTQGTLTAQVASRNALLADAAEENGSIRLSWMPWNHIGGVIHLHYAIEDAGTYYIDEGKPLPGQFAETLRNLHEIIPAEFNTVPIMYGHVVDALEKDADLRERFFRSVRYMSYGSAALSDDILQRLQALSIATIGTPTAFCTKYGTTEVQAITHSAQPMERAGEIGIPYPGVQLKLAPVGDKLEIRAKGDMITPGYLGRASNDPDTFDEEGYYRSGDAAAFVDPSDPAKGLMFDGRVSENFKLATGTWVSVGPLRVALIEALAPLAQDIVVAGHDRSEIAIMLWVKPDAAVAIGGLTDAASPEQIAVSPGVHAFIREKLSAHNRLARGSSQKVARALVLVEPPVGDEQAEKGYINQRRVLARRAAVVERLYAAPPPPEVIVAGA